MLEVRNFLGFFVLVVSGYSPLWTNSNDFYYYNICSVIVYLFSSSFPCWLVAVSVTSVPDASTVVSSMIGSKLIKEDAVEVVERLLGVL